jgi:TPR repeat protein
VVHQIQREIRPVQHSDALKGLEMEETHEHLLVKSEELFDTERYGEALAQYRRLAEAGHPRAQLMVGWIYHHGLGLQENLEEARKWYSLAAGQGSMEAQFNLGVLCMKQGDFVSGRDWYQKAASRGYLPARYRLAWSYESGSGTTIDREEAFHLFEQTAKEGHLPSQMVIAKRLLSGYRGPIQRLVGLVFILKTYMQTVWIASRDPQSDRIRL